MGHVYFMKWGNRVLALLGLIVGPIFIAVIWREPAHPTENPNLVPLMLITALLLSGAYQTANAFISRITLYQDSVELRTAFNRRSLRFSEIRGRREYIGMSRAKTRYFKLEPNDNRLNSLSFAEQAFTFDQAFFDWFNELPNLDAADEKKWIESKSGLA